MLRQGRVIDFLNLGLGSLRTGIFNVADVALSMGIVLLLAAQRRGGCLASWRASRSGTGPNPSKTA